MIVLGWHVVDGVRRRRGTVWYGAWVTKKKIKYLRVPDTLLDAVKEEQARAREAGRSARGGPGPGPRGTPSPLHSRFSFLFLIVILARIHHPYVRR